MIARVLVSLDRRNDEAPEPEVGGPSRLTSRRERREARDHHMPWPGCTSPRMLRSGAGANCVEAWLFRSHSRAQR